MGREVKRVPAGFPAEINKVWFGYVLDAVPCQLCGGHTGERKQGPTTVRYAWQKSDEDSYETKYCELCEGEGRVSPQIEVPLGDAYQMWETVSEGSPISPPFATPEELARWMVEHDTSVTRDAAYEDWLRMIATGSAPSLIMNRSNEATTVQSGVAATPR